MKNKILLVDDEKVFLRSLKKGLEHLENIFTTDICFSVIEAENLIAENNYSLIITDIRMPYKTGIDLLIYLKGLRFKGGIKVMSAHKTEENIQKINGLGIIDVISKPFDLEWFQGMIVEFFEKEDAADITFESIELISVLQVINIDNKSVVIQIDNNGERGLIYFKNGEIINAEFGDFTGEEALLVIMNSNVGNILVKKIKKKVKVRINIPFTKLIMNIMKTIDEIKTSSINLKKTESELELTQEYEIDKDEQNIFDIGLDEDNLDKIDMFEDDIIKENIINTKEENMSTMSDMLKVLNSEVNGLKTASIFGKDGMPLAVENPGGLDIDAFSAKFAMVSALVSKSIRDLSGGTLAEILVEEEKGWFILRPLGNSGLSLFIAVSRDATLGNLRLVARKLAGDAEKFV